MTEVMWLTPGYPWSGDPVGGIFYRTQAHALSRLGIHVTVVAPTPWTPWPLSALRHKWARYATAPAIGRDGDVVVTRPRYVNLPGQPSLARPDRQMAAAAWRAREAWGGARLVHGHYALTGIAAWRVATRARLPFALTFHGDDINSWPTAHPDRVGDLRRAVSDASLVVAVSGPLADRIRDLTGVEAVSLPLGVDHQELAGRAMPQPDARQRLGIARDAVVVLFVGYLLREKGVRELAEAILALGPPYMAVMVGEGPELGYGTADPRASGRLDYRGARPHDEIAVYLSAADVLVLPSYSEGMPTVLVEAGSLGVPVIATAVGGVPDLLGSDRGTLLATGEPEAIRAALHAFTSDRGAAREAADRLRQHVLEQYDVDRNAMALVGHYQAALRGAGSP